MRDISSAPQWWRCGVTENGVTKKVVFSGDVGNLDQPILKDPQFVREADFLLIESTYGNRIHPAAGDVKAQLARVVLSTFRQGGKVVIRRLRWPHAGNTLLSA